MIRRLGAGLLLLAAGGCDAPSTVAGAVALPVCGSAPALQPSAPGDTLHVVVGVAGDGPVALLLRVDAPEDSDISFPDDAPTGASAAGLAVRSRGVFQVCASADPAEIGFRADAVPHERAWLRVTTRRPVRARLEFASGQPGVVVRAAPGESARSPVVGGPEAGGPGAGP